jgi:Ni,Fe-hydrogenase I large subunit
MTRIAIDPITRIEGHLRIEADVADGAVREAWSSGTMFRGLELILRGRDPRDAWLFAQRACGVCTTVHALASVRSVEDALGLRIPRNARLVRNLIAGMQFVQDHVIHFYHLHALDWVDVIAALSADPAATAALARSISDWPMSSEAHFAAVRDKLQALVDSGQLGPFANGYWGHPAYRLPPEVDLMAVTHYLEALDWQRNVIRAHALLGAKNPHPQTYVVGGMALGLDPESPTALNARGLSEMSHLIALAKDFVDRVHIPDVLAIGGFYRDWASIGRGIGNYLSYGDFPEDDSGGPTSFYLPSGRVMRGDLGSVEPVDQSQVAEQVAHSHYRDPDGDDRARHPWDGVTDPSYDGPEPPYETLEGFARYSWLKAPRYADEPMEVGPLARMLVAYASGHADVRTAIDGLLRTLGVGPDALSSTLGRVVARAVETQLIAARLRTWFDDLAENIDRGDLAVADVSRWDPSNWPAEARGSGLVEAPRGSLGHWVLVKGGTIAAYQMVAPSTWNISPRDARGRRGALEEALVGTPVADVEQPVEILRTVHSFDPCLACAVHIHDQTGRRIVEIGAP